MLVVESVRLNNFVTQNYLVELIQQLTLTIDYQQSIFMQYTKNKKGGHYSASLFYCNILIISFYHLNMKAIAKFRGKAKSMLPLNQMHHTIQNILVALL